MDRIIKPYVPFPHLPKGYNNILSYYQLYPQLYKIQNGKVKIDPAWTNKYLIKVDLSIFNRFPPYVDPTIKVTSMYIHKVAFEALRRVWARLLETGLVKYLTSYAGCYNPRLSTGSKDTLSTHSLGIAIDFNSRENRYGLPAKEMEMRPEVVRIFEEEGWCWGGRWNPTDGMHFQYTQPYDGSNWDLEPYHFLSSPDPEIKQIPVSNIKLYNISNQDGLNALAQLMNGNIKRQANGNYNLVLKDFGCVVTIEGDTLSVRRV